MSDFLAYWRSVIRNHTTLERTDERAFQMEFRRRSYQISLLVLLIAGLASTALVWLQHAGHGQGPLTKEDAAIRLTLAWLPPVLLLISRSWSERWYPWVIAFAVTTSLSFGLFQPFYNSVVLGAGAPTTAALLGLQLRTVVVAIYITALLQLPFRFAWALAFLNYFVFAAILVSAKAPDTPSILLRTGVVVVLGILVSLIIEARERRLFAMRQELERNQAAIQVANAEAQRRLQGYLDTQEAALREIKALEDAALAERNRRLQFIRDMLHDMRGIISALGGSLDTYEQAVSQGKPELAARAATNVKRSYSLTNRLTDDLFVLSSYELRHASEKLHAVDLRELLENVAISCHQAAAAKGIELRIYIPGNQRLYCRSNEGALHRVLINLANNAVKFTGPRAGKVSGVVIGAVQNGGYITIHVRDTGVGIPAERMADIWRYGETTVGTNREKGYGIGLPMVRAICDSMPEHIVDVTSRPGKGTRFWVRVPVDDEVAVPESRVADAPDVRSLEGLNVLVVDDTDTYLESHALLVSLVGGNPLAVESAHAACEATRSFGKAPDLILTDFHLGGGEKGTAVITAVREQWSSEIPVIMVTGDSSTVPLDAVRGFAGVVVLKKPLTRAALIREAARLLPAEQVLA